MSSADRVAFYMTLDTALAQKVVLEAASRKLKPADLVERIIEMVFKDNLVDGVLDEDP